MHTQVVVFNDVGYPVMSEVLAAELALSLFCTLVVTWCRDGSVDVEKCREFKGMEPRSMTTSLSFFKFIFYRMVLARHIINYMYAVEASCDKLL